MPHEHDTAGDAAVSLATAQVATRPGPMPGRQPCSGAASDQPARPPRRLVGHGDRVGRRTTIRYANRYRPGWGGLTTQSVGTVSDDVFVVDDVPFDLLFPRVGRSPPRRRRPSRRHFDGLCQGPSQRVTGSHHTSGTGTSRPSQRASAQRAGR
jgi:hypothetical protein